MKSILDDYDYFDVPKTVVDEENIELRPYIPRRKKSDETAEGGEKE